MGEREPQLHGQSPEGSLHFVRGSKGPGNPWVLVAERDFLFSTDAVGLT